MPRSRVTLKDVAAASGVSTATASFVLNRVTSQTIAPATQERVRRAAAELGYVPQGSARALREGKSRLVLLNAGRLPVVGSLRSFIDGLDTELAAHGHTLLVRHGSGALQPSVDIADPRAVIDLVRLYADDDPDRLDGGWIDGLAAHTATQLDHLITRGHTRIGFALPTDERLAGIARLRFQQAREVTRSRGLPDPVEFTAEMLERTPGTSLPAAGKPRETAVARGETEAARGAKAAGRRGVTVARGGAGGLREEVSGMRREAAAAETADLGLGAARGEVAGLRAAAGDVRGTAVGVPDGVTAVAAFDDDVALRLLSAMADVGLSAPGDLAVIGFDDSGYGGLWRPALTTVRIDAAGYGRRAARAVLGLPINAVTPEPSIVVERASA